MRVILSLILFIGICFAQFDVGNCTREQVATCLTTDINQLPLCATGVRPTFSIRTCCYDCKLGDIIPPDPTGCIVDLETIRPCNPGESPVRTQNGCPSCRPTNGIPDAPNCTRSDFTDCETLIPTLPTCTNDVPLQRIDCCINCKPVVESPCNRTQIAACVANFPQLRQCNAGESPAFDRATCCRTCRRLPPTIPDQPDGQGRCTREQILRCLSTIDSCKPGEVPYRNETNQCCPSCKRPESTCARESVVDCTRNLRPCAAGEVPSRVDGECCPTCRPPRPVCNPTCAANEVCVRRRNGPTCVRTRRLVFARLVRLANLTGEDLRTLIREIVQRFCEQNQNRRVCLQFGQSFDEWDELLHAVLVAIANGKIEIDIPAATSATSKRQITDFVNLVESALSDQTANGGFQFDSTDGSSGTEMGSSATTIVASFLFSVILAFLF